MNEMDTFSTGAIRENKTGKGRMDLLPMCALMRLGRHMEKALEDHPERNWEKGLPMHSFLDSAIRHLFKYMDGWDDEDHLCSAAWNILCAMWTEEKRPDMQDIPSRRPETVSPSVSIGLNGPTPASDAQDQEKALREARRKLQQEHCFG